MIIVDRSAQIVPNLDSKKVIPPDKRREDFIRIKGRLDKLALAISSLQLWLDEKIAEGALKEEDFPTP